MFIFYKIRLGGENTKKIYGLFAIILGLVLITGCDLFSKKKEEQSNTTTDNQTSASALSTITCTGLDSEEMTMVATLDDDKVVKVVQKENVTFDSEQDAQQAYSDSSVVFEMFANVDGISYSIDINGKVIDAEVIIEISKLKTFINNNPDLVETLGLDTLLLETEEQFKNYAKENDLRSCIKKMN